MKVTLQSGKCIYNKNCKLKNSQLRTQAIKKDKYWFMIVCFIYKRNMHNKNIYIYNLHFVHIHFWKDDRLFGGMEIKKPLLGGLY